MAQTSTSSSVYPLTSSSTFHPPHPLPQAQAAVLLLSLPLHHLQITLVYLSALGRRLSNAVQALGHLFQKSRALPANASPPKTLCLPTFQVSASAKLGWSRTEPPPSFLDKESVRSSRPWKCMFFFFLPRCSTLTNAFVAVQSRRRARAGERAPVGDDLRGQFNSVDRIALAGAVAASATTRRTSLRDRPTPGAARRRRATRARTLLATLAAFAVDDQDGGP